MCYWVNAGNAKDRRMCSLPYVNGGCMWGIWSNLNVKFTESDGTEFAVGDTYADNGYTDININMSTVLRDFGPYKAGDIVPYGMRQTLLILEYRNRVLKDAGWEIPAATDGLSETERLKFLMNIHSDNNGTAYYYPAASFCYAYEPKADNLAEKFKAHHWFLPPPVDLLQIKNSMMKSDGFTKAATEKLMAVNFLNSWSCQEDDGNGAWSVNSLGGVNYWPKNRQTAVRAVAAF